MVLANSDLKFYKSLSAGSTGGTISTTELTSGLLHDLFDAVPHRESQLGATEYRKIFVKNSSPTDDLTNALLYLSIPTTSLHDELYLGVGGDDGTDGSNELLAMTAGALITVASTGADTRFVVLAGETVAGIYTSEAVQLNGASEVVSANQYKKIYIVLLTEVSVTNTVTVRQGVGGLQLGTIPAGKTEGIHYLSAISDVTAVKLGTIASGSTGGIWVKRVVSAQATTQSNNTARLRLEGTY